MRPEQHFALRPNSAANSLLALSGVPQVPPNSLALKHLIYNGILYREKAVFRDERRFSP
jgi:hypothetical protein